MKAQKHLFSVIVSLAFLTCGVMLFANPMSTAFTYQGRLLDGNIAANGVYDFEFTLHFNDPNGLLGVQVMQPVYDVQVTDGYFITELDYGSDSFNGETRWLEVSVRPGESTEPNDFVTLNPAIELTATPYALQTRGLFVDEDTLNVGIGTTHPTEKLEVAGTIKADAFVGEGSGLTNISFSETDPQIGTNATNYVPRWDGSALVTGTIYDNGNVGIGNQAPSSKLDIGSTSDTGNTIRIASDTLGGIIFYDAESTGCGGMQYAHTNNSLTFTTENPGGGNSIKMAIDSDGNVGIGDQYPLAKLEVAGTIFSNTGGFKFPDGTTQTTASSGDGHSLDAADGTPTDALNVDNDGNIGVGVTNPETKLHVKNKSTTEHFQLKLSNPYSAGANAGHAGILFHVEDDQVNRGKGGILYENLGYYNQGNMHFLQNNAADSSQASLSDSVMTIRIDGNVGIGITNPQRKLHISDVMRLQPRSSPPSSPVEGDIYYSSTLHSLMVYNGVTWKACF